jgi:cytoskeleton protein RodZ
LRLDEALAKTNKTNALEKALWNGRDLMALFSRSLKPGGDAGSPAANGDSDAENGPRHTIGELLRETRQSYGGDIDRIAGMLRIKASYLTAIEESHYDKLPGPVYAQGFVRAYAVHLGLDGNEAIRRFKQEVDGFEVSRDLSFPVPLAERSIPGGTMVLAALILAICGYGLWYYVSTSDRSHPERVSAVPPDLIAATKKPTPAATPPATPAPATTAPTEASGGAPAATAPSTTPAPVLTPPSTLAAAPPTPSSPTPTVAPPVAAPTTAAVQAAPAPTTSVLSTPSAVPPTQTASAPAATAAQPSTDAASSPAAGQPRVYGVAPGQPARIVVHAIKDSWVQVSAGSDVLVQRTLHPGDTVRVPDESGLSFRTGNGAGIQFEIDGKLFKPLSGTVRNVNLDADRLAANGGSPPRAE